MLCYGICAAGCVDEGGVQVVYRWCTGGVQMVYSLYHGSLQCMCRILHCYFMELYPDMFFPAMCVFSLSWERCPTCAVQHAGYGRRKQYVLVSVAPNVSCFEYNHVLGTTARTRGEEKVAGCRERVVYSQDNAKTQCPEDGTRERQLHWKRIGRTTKLLVHNIAQ